MGGKEKVSSMAFHYSEWTRKWYWWAGRYQIIRMMFPWPRHPLCPALPASCAMLAVSTAPCFKGKGLWHPLQKDLRMRIGVERASSAPDVHLSFVSLLLDVLLSLFSLLYLDNFPGSINLIYSILFIYYPQLWVRRQTHVFAKVRVFDWSWWLARFLISSSCWIVWDVYVVSSSEGNDVVMKAMSCI
jgi:hypothetical protein